MSREVPRSVDEAFFAGTRSAEVPFVVNDAVRVSSGPHEGRSGAVISIESTRPTMRLLIETGDGAEIVVDASTLTLVTR
jgi:transcription antitermination factor NusG